MKEAYTVDNNRVPPACGVGGAFNPYGNFAEPLSARFHVLTTSVGYLSSVPGDPFPSRQGWGHPDLTTYDTYDYVDADTVPERGTGLTSGGDWRIASAGPDLYQAYGGRLASEPLPEVNARGVDYDPTNGTSSWGDLVRVGRECNRYGDPMSPANPLRPGIVRVPRYVEQWKR